MKARVKATGKIVDVMLEKQYPYRYIDMNEAAAYYDHQLEFEIEGKFAESCLNEIKQGVIYDPDYWTRLEHQYTGMVMQGIVSNSIVELDYEGDEGCFQAVAAMAYRFAHALVEKLKSENNG